MKDSTNIRYQECTEPQYRYRMYSSQTENFTLERFISFVAIDVHIRLSRRVFEPKRK